MKRLRLVIFGWLVFPVMTFAYEKSMPNLRVPSRLEAGQIRFSVRHRFYGAVDDEPFGTFFGLRYGGNVGLGLSGVLGRGFEAGMEYVFRGQEWNLGAAYNVIPADFFLAMRLEATFFSFEPFPDDRRTGWSANLALQTNPLLSRIRPAVNLAFDSHYEEWVIGVGLEAVVAKRFSLLGEAYPNPVDGREASIAIGFRLETYGHHFLLLVGRSTDIGVRHIGLGSVSKDWHLGFTIHRWFGL